MENSTVAIWKNRSWGLVVFFSSPLALIWRWKIAAFSALFPLLLGCCERGWLPKLGIGTTVPLGSLGSVLKVNEGLLFVPTNLVLGFGGRVVTALGFSWTIPPCAAQVAKLLFPKCPHTVAPCSLLSLGAIS